MEKDFYDILGLDEQERKLTGDKFDKVLKKKYKKLAMKWHPDRFSTKSEKERKEAEEKFKNISEAYTTLSDEKKRQEYDLSQNGGFGGNPFGGFGGSPFGFGGSPFGGFGDIFGDIFGNRSGRSNVRRKGRDIELSINISLKEAFNGVQKNIRYNRTVPCTHCNGTGSSDGKTHECPHCHGTGMETTVHRNGNISMTQQTVCRYCHGSGKEASNPCSYCNGTGQENKPENITVNISKGFMPGGNIVYNGMGEAITNGEPGDLYVHVNISDSNGFHMDSTGNLVYTKEVPMVDALLGMEFDVELLDGKKTHIKVPELTKDNSVFVKDGQGYYFGESGRKSRLIVELKYKYPDKLTEEDKKLLKKLRK